MEDRLPFAAALTLAVVLALAGLVVPLVTRLAASGRLPRNAVAGIRTEDTRVSSRAWQAAHAAAVSSTDLAGLVFLLSAVAAVLPQPPVRTVVVVLVGTAVATALLLRGSVRAQRAARAAEA